MWDAVKSKLFPQIMEALAVFFGLGSDATESEIHNALDGQKPLKDQIEEARSAAIEATAADLKSVKDRLQELEARQTATDEEMSAKDTRIAELQTQIAQHEQAANDAKAANEAMKSQHQKEINVLAGQVAALRAGKPLEQSEGGDRHPGEVNAPADGVLTIKSDELKKIATRAASN